jgi:CubicO group peptidase (beta-lactamase class C family)
MDRGRRIQKVLQDAVDAGDLAGAVAAVWRDGQIETARAGWRDKEAQLPIERDTIFRIASMTKPITSVAALTLIDEGKIALNDPISAYAPEFSQMRVLKSPDGPLDETEDSAHAITFEHLLTHRSGLTYKDFHRGPIVRAYHEALGGDIDSDVAPDDWIRRLAHLPLIGQPGSAMYYGRSTDQLGLLIARIEGTSLGAVLERRVFGPLGMRDTGFVVPPEKQHRRAAAYGFNETGQLMKRTTWSGAWGDVAMAERPQNMAYESGGQGLWSTMDDYLKFTRLFLGDGAVDGVRLLRPETLDMMMTNQLTDAQPVHPGWLGLKPGRGFGLGVSVVLETDKADFMRRGSVGTVSWPGAFGGWWQADPKQRSAFIFLAHNMVDLAQMAKGIGLGVWAAIEEFQNAAMALERDPVA